MALGDNEWRAIQEYVERRLGQVGEPFLQSVVVKNDPVNKLVWVAELGDIPIPMIAFDYRVKYYDVEPTGNTTPVGSAVNTKTIVKRTKDYTDDVEVLVPQIGDTVLIAKHLGTGRLPKCLGIVKSDNYVLEGGE